MFKNEEMFENIMKEYLNEHRNYEKVKQLMAEFIEKEATDRVNDILKQPLERSSADLDVMDKIGKRY